MAEPLKLMYSNEYINNLGNEIYTQHSSFNKKAFVKDVLNHSWPQLELKQRMYHIVHCVHKHLPLGYAQQIEVLIKVAPHFSGFTAMLFPEFVAQYGLHDLPTSIKALEWFTQFSSSEFAVRPFMIKYEKQLLKQHAKWATHKNEHVRRLASEGIRPRLPWAMALPEFKQYPEKILPVLALLMEDPSEYVRRSVANCLNDISKDHPELLLQMVVRWKNKNKHTDALLKHACRTLLKAGNPKALQLFNVHQHHKYQVNSVNIHPKQLAIGDTLSFEAEVQSLENEPFNIRLEYKIYFVKANGKTSNKIFQIGTYALKPNQKIAINRKHKLADLTTRKHYPGEHGFCLVINGKEEKVMPFLLK